MILALVTVCVFETKVIILFTAKGPVRPVISSKAEEPSVPFGVYAITDASEPLFMVITSSGANNVSDSVVPVVGCKCKVVETL